MRHPYAFRVMSGHEDRAAKRLLRFDVQAKNPFEYIRLRENEDGVCILKDRAQLPGYFVGLFPAERWFDVRDARYPDGSMVLGRPLSIDGQIRPLDTKTFQIIEEMNSYAEEAPVIPTQHGLKPGDYVILRGGTHAGKRLRVERTNKSGVKAIAVLKILGALREVTFDADLAEVVAA